jgi:hypothetical protein
MDTAPVLADIANLLPTKNLSSFAKKKIKKNNKKIVFKLCSSHHGISQKGHRQTKHVPSLTNQAANNFFMKARQI